MKACYTFLFIIAFVNNCICQDGFKWEKTGEVSKTKDKIYADTKMFVAQYWKSAQDVIQNDDKETGVILIKGVTETHAEYSLNYYTYVYRYTVTFKMKDGKYLISLDGVHSESARASECNSSVIEIEPFEGEPTSKTVSFGSCNGIPKTKAIRMMDELKQNLQAVIDDYEAFIKTSHDW